MRITFGRGQQPRCGHTRVEPHSVQGVRFGDVTLHAICMDCGKPTTFACGYMKDPDEYENWTRVLRANGYMQNAANNALWEKVV